MINPIVWLSIYPTKLGSFTLTNKKIVQGECYLQYDEKCKNSSAIQGVNNKHKEGLFVLQMTIRNSVGKRLHALLRESLFDGQHILW